MINKNYNFNPFVDSDEEDNRSTQSTLQDQREPGRYSHGTPSDDDGSANECRAVDFHERIDDIIQYICELRPKNGVLVCKRQRNSNNRFRIFSNISKSPHGLTPIDLFLDKDSREFNRKAEELCREFEQRRLARKTS